MTPDIDAWTGEQPTLGTVRRRRRAALLWVAAGLAVALLAATDLISYRTVADRPEPVIAGVERIEVPQRYHTDAPVSYDRIPPAGGPHAPIWLNCGVYTEPVRSENAVHSMEHGAVWITYRPDLPADRVQPMQHLVRRRHHTILSPYDGLPAPVVASAWGRQLRLDDPTDPRLAAFVTAYHSGPQTPEIGGPCDHGVGTPSP